MTGRRALDLGVVIAVTVTMGLPAGSCQVATGGSRQEAKSRSGRNLVPVESAKDVLQRAAKSAKESDKRLFVLVGASYCAPCKEFWRDLQQKPIWPIIDRNYIVVHLTGFELQDAKHLENEGTVEFVRKWTGVSYPGIPYYAVLDTDLNWLDDSMYRTKRSQWNASGLTSQQGDRMRAVLEKTAPRITKADLADLERWMRNPYAYKSDGG